MLREILAAASEIARRTVGLEGRRRAARRDQPIDLVAPAEAPEINDPPPRRLRLRGELPRKGFPLYREALFGAILLQAAAKTYATHTAHNWRVGSVVGGGSVICRCLQTWELVWGLIRAA